MGAMSDIRAEIHLPTTSLTKDLNFFTKTLGFRLDMIYPADNPAVIVVSGHGLRLRIDAGLDGRTRPSAHPDRRSGKSLADGGAGDELTAGGTRGSTLHELNPPLVLPATEHAFVVRRLADQAPWVIGRAGMAYRDLVPTRLGGAIIASHIRVPDGPVPDMVHFHKVGFQLIFCVRGWVDVLL